MYQYNRLHLGVKAAPGIFQQTMDILLADLSEAVIYLDDIIFMGCSKQNHDENLNAVLQRIQEWGFHLRVDNCSFRLEQIRYI